MERLIQFEQVSSLWRCSAIVASVALLNLVAGIAPCLSQSPGGELRITPVLLTCIEEASLPALQEGPVTKVHVREGDAIVAGAAVVQLDDRMARFRKEKCEVEFMIARKKATDESAVQLAETEIKVATANLERAMESRKRFRDTPSQAEIDDLELRLAQSRQHFEKAQNEVALAKLAEELAQKTLEGSIFDWERFAVQSPIEGVVVEVLCKPGDWVRPGQPLARVIRTNRLRAEGHIQRSQAAPGLIGRSVEFVMEDEPSRAGKHLGKIVFLSVEVDPNDRRQRIIAEIDNSQGTLGPGLRGMLIVR